MMATMALMKMAATTLVLAISGSPFINDWPNPQLQGPKSTPYSSLLSANATRHAGGGAVEH